MARTFHVYPKATLVNDTWTLIVKIYEPSTRTNWRYTHTAPSVEIAAAPLTELKMSFDLVTANTDTPQDIDDALFLDDISPGPQVETVWSNWQGRAEAIIAGLTTPYTVADYWAAWSKQDTANTRTDAKRALITQRGWAVSFIHWHEGDGTYGDEVT